MIQSAENGFTHLRIKDRIAAGVARFYINRGMQNGAFSEKAIPSVRASAVSTEYSRGPIEAKKGIEAENRRAAISALSDAGPAFVVLETIVRAFGRTALLGATRRKLPWNTCDDPSPRPGSDGDTSVVTPSLGARG